MTGTLQGRVALVTGGRGGTGRAVCHRFTDEGAYVHAAGLSDDCPADEAPAAGEFLRFDVSSEDGVVAGIAAVESARGRLDIVVNAVGIEIEKTVENTSLEEWDRIFTINATGTFLTSKHALRLLRQSDHAAIVDFGSYAGF